MLSRVRRWFSARVPELAPREAYRLWAESYPPYAHNLLMQVEQEAMCELLPALEQRRVLDLGCGFGLFSLYYASVRPSIEIAGIDLNERRIAMARRAAGQSSRP